ncbi:MAG: hypothetical protein M1817_006141 [Caeruleum heppii]|nr:MAG: hypothetical protein M1817_006141 [Caeruleum heppii]
MIISSSFSRNSLAISALLFSTLLPAVHSFRPYLPNDVDLQTTNRSLQRRIEEGFREGEIVTFDLPGTDFVAKVTIKDMNPTEIMKPLPGLLERDASRLAPQDNLPRRTIWPTSDFFGKFDIVRSDPNCAEPPLNGDLLRAFGAGFNNLISNYQYPDNSMQGTIARRDSPDVAFFMFRLFGVSSRVVQSEKRDDVTFNERDVIVVHDIKKKILSVTKPDDLILFIGNTGSYFYYAFKPTDNRNVHLIPLSGQCYYRGTSPTPSNLAAYRRRILDPAFATRKPGSRVILVDHVRSGISIDNFVEALDRSGVYADEALLINLAYPHLTKNHVSGAFDVTYLATFPVGWHDDHFARFDEGFVGRLLPYYARELWGSDWREVPNPDQRFAQNTIDLIQRFGVIQAGI